MITVNSCLADTPLLRTSHSYEHLALTNTPLLRTPRSYGYPALTDTPLLRAPRSYGYPALTNTPLLRTPGSYEHPALTDTSLLRTPRSYGHLALTDTPLLWIPPLLRTPRSYGYPALTDTSLLQYGQKINPRLKLKGNVWKQLPLLRNLAIMEFRTLHVVPKLKLSLFFSRYITDNFDLFKYHYILFGAIFTIVNKHGSFQRKALLKNYLVLILLQQC